MAMVIEQNHCPFVLVHGVCGWGKGNSCQRLMPSYWAGAEAFDQDLNGRGDGLGVGSVGVGVGGGADGEGRQQRRVFMPSLGPLSSHHTRACELYFQLKGGRVDLGPNHARNGATRYGRTYEQGMYPEWDSEHPLHFVGHSMGGDTIRTLMNLLADERSHLHAHWKREEGAGRGSAMSTAWMKSLTTVSTPLNGTPAVDFLGYDSFNKKVR